ncbi:MAG: hypothetical protein DYG89_51485 [Caldilinea sp. CFX5]|nr:hypothetical protein [Caldilinea sp. CFX5]
MKVTQVSTVVNSTQVSAARTWLIDTAVGELPQPFFRRALYLRFALDGVADGLRLVPEQTHFRGHFDSYSYNAKTITNPALAAVTKTVDQAVLVELPTPRQLTAVQLVNAFVSGLSSKVTVHRVDGEQVVEEPTATATFGAPFDLFIGEGIALSTGAFASTRATAPSENRIGDTSTLIRTVADFNTAALATDFTDARFGLRLSNSSTTLTPALLAGVTVRSYPSAPRLGVAAATSPLTPTFFLRLDGEIGKDGDANAGHFDAGDILAVALQTQVDAFFTQVLTDTALGDEPALPTELTVALVLESDAPCQLVIDEFVIGYQLVRRTFPDRAEKLVLRFAGDAVATEEVTFHLPKTAVVTAATLTVAAKLRNDGLVAPAATYGLPPESLTQATGVHLGLARWAAQPLTPIQAVTASGVVIGLLTLTANTQLALAFYEDWQGQPGKQLTATTIDLGQSGQRLWQTVRFPEPVLLFTQPYWLLLKALRGAALWLAQEGTPTLQMLTQENQRWQTVSVITNTQGLLHLLSPTVGDNQQSPPLALRIDGVSITTTPVTSGDRQRHDLTAALNAALVGAATSSLVRTLAFTTGQAGTLTVYPPEIIYEG